MAVTRFSDLATPNSDLTKSRPKYTTTSGLTTTFLTHFRIKINFTAFRTILGTFESTSGFWIVLPGQDLDFLHPVFVYKAFLAVCVRYGDNTGQNKAKKSVPGALEAKPEVEIWWRPVFLTQRPRVSIWRKVGQSTQLFPVLQIHFRFHHDDFLHAFFELWSISRHFGPFWALLNVLPGHKFRHRAPDFLIESISSRLCAIRRQYKPK